MKKRLTKMIAFSLILFGFTCNRCSNWVEKHYPLQIANNSNIDIAYYFYLAWQGGHDGVVYPDTLLSFNQSELVAIKSGKQYKTYFSHVPITDWISSLPRDTLSVFYFHTDTLAKYKWDEIKERYKVLRRYDLSIEDINILHNKDGVPEIPYPPDERMKNMKMYPPYDNNE